MSNRCPSRTGWRHLATALPVVAVLLVAGAASPANAQGAFASPPSPNSSQSMPQSANSAPGSARTLAPGSTSIGRIGTLHTTRVSPRRRPIPVRGQAEPRQ